MSITQLDYLRLNNSSDVNLHLLNYHKIEEDSSNYTNGSGVLEVFEFLAASRITLPPTWFVWAFLAVVAFGGFLSNGLLAVYLSRRRIFPSILHLCLTDITSLLFLAPYEILILSDPTGVWYFPPECCPIFTGLEVLLGTATIYLLIVLNFSSAIGHDKISLKVPLLTVWLLSISLSVPDFIFAEVILPRPQYSICCVPKKAAFLIGAFRLSLPVFLLIIGFVINIFIWFKNDNSRYMCLSMVLTLSYVGLSVQRNVLGVLYSLYPPMSTLDYFRTPPLADVAHNPLATLTLAMVHYSLSALRPIMSWIFSSEMRTAVTVTEQNNDSNEV